jgi:hypothetical protein
VRYPRPGCLADPAFALYLYQTRGAVLVEASLAADALVIRAHAAQGEHPAQPERQPTHR